MPLPNKSFTRLPTGLYSHVDGSGPFRYDSTSDSFRLVGTGGNVAARVRDASENYPNPGVWNEAATIIAPGDLILQSGNTAGAGWIELSKSPFDAGGSTVLELLQRFTTPIRIAHAITMSQRAAGQHIGSVEFVSTDDWLDAVPVPDPVPVPIDTASQSTTTITVNFAAPPAVPFRIGQRVNVYGFVDNRLNVSSATVATTPTPVQITLVGNGHAFTSTTIASTPGGGNAFVERVDVLGGARNGVAILRESGTVTQQSIYSRSEGGLARPSGALAGSHQLTTGTDLATVLVAAPGAYAFVPQQQTRLDLSRDGFVVSDRATNGSNALFTPRYRHDEVVPNPGRPYKLRYRLRSSRAPSRPIAEIVSVSKAGSTTATFTTRAPHGLVTGQWIGHYGVANQTSFAAQAAGVQCTVTGPNTFTAVTGASATATSFGGFVFVSEGQQALPGAVAQAITNVARANNVLTLTGNATWAGPVIGEVVEVYGLSNVTDGASLGLDGPYRVVNLATTALTLEPVGSAPTGADIASTPAGGGVIRRTDMRIHYSVAVDYEPQLIEFAHAGFAEQGVAPGINIVGTPPVSVSSGTLTAVTAANLGIPGIIADAASAAVTSSATTAAITPTFGTSYEVVIPVTAVTGAGAFMDVGIEESDDSGTNWFRVYDFPRITATGAYRSPKLPLTGNRLRYVQTLGGTTPSFTRAISRNQASDAAPLLRQLIDRTIVPTTLNSATPALSSQNCRSVQLVANLGAATTPPALQIEGSEDNGATWYAIGSPLTAVANATVQLTVPGVQSGLVRARVSTAGSAVTLGWVLVKAF